MSLLIDGYNLLNAVSIIGHGRGASSLERSRLALLDFLAESLDPEELSATTIVFGPLASPRAASRFGVSRPANPLCRAVRGRR